MKPFFKISLTVVFMFSIFSAVIFVSCVPRDKCTGVVCKNGGVCNKGNNGADYCTCPSGFGGSNCDIMVRDKFLGNWTQVSDSPSIANLSISVTTAHGVKDVLITGFGAPVDSVVAAYMVKDDQLYMPPQIVRHITIEGYITYVGKGLIRAVYNLTDAEGRITYVNAGWK